MNLTTEEILALYRQVARPYLDEAFQPNRCVEQSRVLIEVLKRFRVAAEPLGTKFMLVCDAKEYAFCSGLDEEEKERGKRKSRAWLHRGIATPEKGVRHCVVIVERRILVDPTFYQASAPPEFCFTLDPDVVIMPFPEPLGEGDFLDIEVVAGGDDGTKFTMRWIGTPDKDWELDDGWEPSHLWGLIDAIEKAMRKEIERQEIAQHLFQVCFGIKL